MVGLNQILLGFFNRLRTYGYGTLTPNQLRCDRHLVPSGHRINPGQRVGRVAHLLAQQAKIVRVKDRGTPTYVLVLDAGCSFLRNAGQARTVVKSTNSRRVAGPFSSSISRMSIPVRAFDDRSPRQPR